MKIYSFYVYGHSNVLCTHKSTIEFTKDNDLSKRGDCILGVKADFDVEKVKEIIKGYDKMSIEITAGQYKEAFIAIANKKFSSAHEMVLRRSAFGSERTLCFGAEKAACNIDRKIVEYLKNPNNRATIEIGGI